MQRRGNQIKHHSRTQYSHITHLTLSKHMHKLHQVNNPSYVLTTKHAILKILPLSNINRMACAHNQPPNLFSNATYQRCQFPLLSQRASVKYTTPHYSYQDPQQDAQSPITLIEPRPRLQLSITHIRSPCEVHLRYNYAKIPFITFISKYTLFHHDHISINNHIIMHIHDQ